MIKKIMVLFIALGSATMMVLADGEVKHSAKPKDGFVPDAQTAIAIAVAVWNPIYGKDNIEKEKPYSAKLTNGVWIVEGSLPKPMTVGGWAIAEISKEDGKILRVSHGK